MDDTTMPRGKVETAGPLARSAGRMLALFALASGALLAGSTFLASSAEAATIVSISGLGDLTIEAEGDIYLDFGQLNLTDLTLSADTSVVVGGDTYPDSVPTTFDSSPMYTGLMGAQNFEFPDGGDVLFGSLVWTGNLTVIASNIYGIGEINIDGLATVTTGGGCPPGTTLIGPGSFIGSGGASNSDPTICAPDEIVVDGGPIEITSGPAITAVPEPTSAVLFAVGAMTLLTRAGTKSRR